MPITNSMIVTWIIAVGLIVFARAATRQMREVPGGAQNLLASLVERLYGLLESIIGRHLVERTFWFFATVFLFILAAHGVGLVPGVPLVCFACWIVWALQESGLRGVARELFAPNGKTTGLLKAVMATVFVAAGPLEVVSILFRPVSLSFRLYGNVFAGENTLETMTRI